MSEAQKAPGEDIGVPLWIVLMWIAGIIWVIGYIILGLQATPTTW